MSDSSSFGSTRATGWAAFLLSVALILPAAGDPAAVATTEASSTAPGSSSPSARIDALHAALLDVMKNATTLGYSGREEKLRKVVPNYFDVDFMARKSLGSHWRKADASEQKRYLDAFTRFMVANYAGRFDGFSGQSFETTGEEPAQRDTVMVKSILRNPSGEDVELNYRLREMDGAWKVIDVYLDGTVSELALRRSEFVSIVKREDIEGLIVALDAKIAKLAEDGAG